MAALFSKSETSMEVPFMFHCHCYFPHEIESTKYRFGCFYSCTPKFNSSHNWFDFIGISSHLSRIFSPVNTLTWGQGCGFLHESSRERERGGALLCCSSSHFLKCTPAKYEELQTGENTQDSGSLTRQARRHLTHCKGKPSNTARSCCPL